MLEDSFSGHGPGGSQGTAPKAMGADAEGAAAEGGVVLKGTGDKTMARRGAEGEKIRAGDKMKGPAHEG